MEMDVETLLLRSMSSDFLSLLIVQTAQVQIQQSKTWSPKISFVLWQASAYSQYHNTPPLSLTSSALELSYSSSAWEMEPCVHQGSVNTEVMRKNNLSFYNPLNCRYVFPSSFLWFWLISARYSHVLSKCPFLSAIKVTEGHVIPLPPYHTMQMQFK